MRRHRGFTLLEVMVVVAIVGILAGISAVALTRAVRAARMSGDRFTLMNAMTFARSRALSVGRDVYVVFVDVDQDKVAPDARAPRVIVYDDANLAMRTHLADPTHNPMDIVTANPTNVRDQFVTTAQSGLFFRTPAATNISTCTVANIPAYFGISTARKTQQDCAPAWCTFCQKYSSVCVGAIRFSPNGTVRVVTGPTGSGGLIKLVEREDAKRSLCIAISEPAGLTMTVPD